MSGSSFPPRPPAPAQFGAPVFPASTATSTSGQVSYLYGAEDNMMIPYDDDEDDDDEGDESSC